MPDYMASADDEMICMITIEHVDAVNRIDEIMATPGIDIAVIGPGDLATSINKRGQMDDPELLELIARAEAGILKSGVPIGGVARTADQANRLVDRGYRAIALGSTGRCSSAASWRRSRGSSAERSGYQPCRERRRCQGRPSGRKQSCSRTLPPDAANRPA